LEWARAIAEHPDLTIENGKRYFPRAAGRTIELDGTNYFDSDGILEQFERLFTLLKFKDDYEGYDIELMIDNARTHTAKPFSINDFRKGTGYRSCPVEKLEWVDENNNECFINTHFDGEDGASKGMFELCKELMLIPVDAQYKHFLLKDLVKLAETHPAFVAKTFLEALAERYGVTLTHLPKFHCELSPIEGVWAHMKQYIRKNTDQTFNALRRLLVEAREHLKTHPLIPKLWRRFWRTVEAYEGGVGFQQILSHYFGVKCHENVKMHRKIADYSGSIKQI